MKPIATPAKKIAATPPTTPSMMKPLLELLFGVGEEVVEEEEVGSTVEEDSPKSDDVALLPVPDAEAVAPEKPSTSPGPCSGESRNRTWCGVLIEGER